MPTIPEAPHKGVLPEEHVPSPCRVCVLDDQEGESIDPLQPVCDNSYTMSNLPESITDVLRRTIIDSGVSYKALSRETGVARASIQRFVDGRQSIRLDMADRLAAYFRLSCLGGKRKNSATLR
jgi:Cro/C1-type HTH DNA-binding domain